MRPIPNHSRAFTLVELLVAIAITAIIIVFASQVLSHVSSATSQGAALSHIIQSSRVVSEQIQQDFDNMVPPDEGGYLVIINHETRNPLTSPADKPIIRFTDDDPDIATIEGLTPAEQAVYRRRSDQIVFIRHRGQAEPLGPGNNTSYSNSTTAPFTRLWYGHALRTNADGTNPPGPLGTAPNDLAAQWILGRQALFLDHESMAPGPIYAEGAWDHENPAEWTVVSGLLNAGPSPAPNEVEFLPLATTDVARVGLTSEGQFGALVGGAEDTTAIEADKRLWETYSGTPNPGEYVKRALRSAYVVRRLRVNPTPEPPFESWQVAQTHPYFVGGVSDFEIAFAGDYNNDSLIDRYDPTNPTSMIEGEIRWYDINAYQRTNPTAQVPVSVNGFVLRTDSPAAGNDPIYDPNPRTIAGFNNADASRVFVFRHGSGQTRWPWLIRLRYRIVDPNARVIGADGIPGRVYEQILKVPR